ncbi:MAG: PQQ-binding-like beta-propeller repeat protein, partial [Chloroflexota bacterium]|nr:PQQ-binding-like beta-propeller repeat protein [Chloroflexota bacterium]
ANGSKIWSVDMAGPVEGSPLPSNDGSTVYASNINGTIMALNTNDGSVKWKIATNNAIRGSLALSPDGSTIYAVLASSGAIDGFLSSGPTSAGSSTPSVIFNPSGPPISSPAVDSNGNIYVTTAYGTVESFAAGGGAARWTFVIPNHFPAASTPAISGGNVYFGAGNGNIYAISQSSGQQVWQLHTNAPVESSPAVASGNGIVYVGSDDGNLYAVNGAAGTAAFIRLLGGYVTSSPAIGPDGSVWIGSQGGGVFRFLDVGLPPPPSVPTPGPSPTPMSTSTPGPTATSAPPTSTATAVATTTPTTLPLTISASTSIKPGASQVVTITSAPNTVVHIRVDYGNGDHQSHKVTTSATGAATYKYVQATSKVTRGHQTATITATVGSGASQNKQTTQYTVKFGAIDAWAVPRAVSLGHVILIYVHAKKRTPVVAYVRLRTGRSATLRGKTGAKGFVHLKLKVTRKSFRSREKVSVQANLVKGRAYTKTFFTVK